MTRFGRLATICIVLVFCAATALSSPAQTLSTLHSFGYNGDGAYPYAGLIQASDGSFYGTTWGGGAYGYGTVFRMSASGTVTTLQSFNFNNGAAPTAGLVQASDGSFYGTTEYGGTSGSCSNGCGTVFQITASGALITLHYFTGGGDGGYPVAGLVQASDGNFYGTTQQDGLDFGGTVFKITPSGTFTTLYNFCSQASCTDGAYPEGALIQASDGDFYGTTYYGGANCTPLGCGTIFKINSSGTLSTLHSFDSIDGEYPQAGLIQATDGNFYGTTWAGGATGHGTIFKCTPSGTLTTLHSFDGSDGSEPVAALLQATDGNFYGTTLGGGSSPNGTIFQSTSSGTLTTLYSFCSENNCADGANPNAALLQASDGNFYATTEGGGTIGNGTTFRLAMGLAPGPLQLIPLTPCRLADTRTQNGGGGPIQGGTYQTFNLPELAQSKDCADLFTAAAYSLNVTVVPQGPLSYLTIWPAGEAQPLVSTMNSLDGRIKANAAIVPAGASRAVSVYASDTTDVVLDIDGYFAPPGSSTLAFYPLTPCRVLDTRWTDGSLGGPYLKTNEERDFPVLESDCNVPSSAQAYSMNFTVVPYNNQPLGYLTVWPQGGTAAGGFDTEQSDRDHCG